MTPEQQAAVEAYKQHGSQRLAADALGISRSALRDRLANAEKWQEAPEGQKAAIEASGLDIGTAKHGWRVIQHEDGSRDSVFWKAEAADRKQFLDDLKEAFSDIKPVAAIDPPSNGLADLMTVYPLMDAHIGMHAWGRETGDHDYDLKLAEKDIGESFSAIDMITPASNEAILILGGDTLHANDASNMTPRSKHVLDTDGRMWKVAKTAVEIISQTAERLAAKHGTLRIRVMRGNHDEDSHHILAMGLLQRYRENPRIIIEDVERDVYWHQWGRSAVIAHHGDKMKPQQVYNHASDRCPFWSSARDRHIFTGHIHHDSMKDLGGAKWWSLRAFCPPDAYGVGFTPRRALQAFTFHRNRGLILNGMEPIWRDV